MQFSKSLIAAAAALVTIGAQAVPVATVGVTGTSFLTLASNGTGQNSGGTFTGALSGTITGGQVLTVDAAPNADKDSFRTGTTTYLTSGVTAGSPSTFAFTGLTTNFLSFQWGSPDAYNSLTVFTSTNGASGTTFTAGGLGLNTSGSQAPGSAPFVAFATTGGETITSLRFSSTQDAFEAANFSVTAPVPEPETYALMLAGLGVLGFVARRRKPV